MEIKLFKTKTILEGILQFLKFHQVCELCQTQNLGIQKLEVKTVHKSVILDWTKFAHLVNFEGEVVKSAFFVSKC